MTSKAASILWQRKWVKASTGDFVSSKFKSYWCMNTHVSVSAHLTCMTNLLSVVGATFCMPTATSCSQLFYGFLCHVVFFHAQCSGAWHLMSGISILYLILWWQWWLAEGSYSLKWHPVTPTINKDTILLQVTQGIRCGEITLDLTSFWGVKECVFTVYSTDKNINAGQLSCLSVKYQS